MFTLNDIKNTFEKKSLESLRAQFIFQVQVAQIILDVIRKKELEIKNSEVYLCTVCKQEFDTFPLIDAHLKVAHPEVNPGEGTAIRIIKKGVEHERN